MKKITTRDSVSEFKAACETGKTSCLPAPSATVSDSAMWGAIGMDDVQLAANDSAMWGKSTVHSSNAANIYPYWQA